MKIKNLDADFLKISHLEARLRGEPEPKFNKFPNFLLEAPQPEKLSLSPDFFDLPTTDFLNPEIGSSSDAQSKQKGNFSEKENLFESRNSSNGKRSSYGGQCIVKKKIKPNGISINLGGMIGPSNIHNNEFIENYSDCLNGGFCKNEINSQEFMNFSEHSNMKNESKGKALNEENISLKIKIETLNIEFQNYKEEQNLIKSKLLIEIEEQKRKSEKSLTVEMKKKYGDFKKKRVGLKFTEVWEEGELISEMKEKLDFLKRKIQENSLNPLSSLINEKEKCNLEKKIEELEFEKHMHQIALLRLNEEENSYFAKNSQLYNNTKYPLLKKRYQVLSFLGRGGFSDVYRGVDLEKMTDIAIKIHYINPSWTEEMKATYLKHSIRESEVHKMLNHPNIVKLYDTIPLEGDSFCSIMDYCDGMDLGTYLKKSKTLPEKEAKLIIYQILKGIKYLHEDYDTNSRIIHYDLKPQNILFHQGSVKITDFGLCKIMDICQNKGNIELTCKGGGTYWYLPPECFEKGFSKINQKVDIWSLGVIFYELIYGKKPFGDQMSQERIVRENVIVNEGDNVVFPAFPAFSNEGKTFVRRCLTYKEEKRWDIKMAINFDYF